MNSMGSLEVMVENKFLFLNTNISYSKTMLDKRILKTAFSTKIHDMISFRTIFLDFQNDSLNDLEKLK